MRVSVKDFNLEHTLLCGQFFQFVRDGTGFVVWSSDDIFWVCQSGSTIEFEGITEARLRHIFSLDIDYDKIMRRISRDKRLAGALKEYKGMRIMRQDFFECLIAYVCSANSNIPKITKNVHLLSQFFGKPVNFRGRTYHLFPKPGKICVPEKVVEAKTGFRARFICEINGMVDQGYIKKIKGLTLEQARERLQELPGVGPKVSDCVLLFSLDRLDAFPIDIWIRRIMHKLYFKEKEKKDRELQEFARKHFGEYCGYANQFLFYASRTE